MEDRPSRLDIAAAPGRVLLLDGVIDSHTAPSLDDALADLGSDGDVTVDLGAVGFADSSGLRAIVAAHGRLESAGSRLVLRSPSEPVRRLLAITDLSGHLHLD